MAILYIFRCDGRGIQDNGIDDDKYQYIIVLLGMLDGELVVVGCWMEPFYQL